MNAIPSAVLIAAQNNDLLLSPDGYSFLVQSRTAFEKEASKDYKAPEYAL